MKTATSAAKALLGGMPTAAPVAARPAARIDAAGTTSRRDATGPASRIDATLNGGVQQGAMEQALQPFMGANALPTGQIINVSMNAPNPNLPFREWMARGVVGGVGHVAAWPFRLFAMTVEGVALAIVDVLKTVLKWALIVVLVPTLMLVGIRLMSKMSESPTIEGGASSIMHDGRHAANGIGKGLTDELPAEAAPPKPRTHPRRESRGER